MNGNRVPETASAQLTVRGRRAEASRRRKIDAELREERTPSMRARDPRNKPIGSWENLSGAMGMTPTDVLGRVAGYKGNISLAALAGGLKAAETFGVANRTRATGRSANPILSRATGMPLPADAKWGPSDLATVAYLAHKTGRTIDDVLGSSRKHKTLQLTRYTDTGELKRLVRDGYTESPSTLITRFDRMRGAIPEDGFRSSSDGPPVFIHYKRKGFDFDVRPGVLDVAVPKDSFSPTTKTVATELAAGKTYPEIFRTWRRTGGVGALNNIIYDENNHPFAVENMSGAPMIIKAAWSDPTGASVNARDSYALSVAYGNKLLGTNWDAIRRRDRSPYEWGELKPLRKVPVSTIDFVEIPRYSVGVDKRTEIIPRNERFALQRDLESRGVQYRVYDKIAPRTSIEDLPKIKYPYQPSTVEYYDQNFRNTPHPKNVIAPKIKGDRFYQDAKGGDAGKGSGAPGPSPKAGRTRRDVRAAGGAGDTKGWTWENYRWNPGSKGGRRIDPENIKGTGIAFDKRDRAVLPESERKAYEKWMDELADPKGEWELENGKKVKVRSELVPKDWRTNKEFDRDYDYVRAYLAGRNDPELAWRMVGPVWHDKEVRKNGEVVPEGYWLHMNDVGKMPTHPTFSTDSLYAKDPELAKKYIKLAGSWSGEEYIPGEAERSVQQAAGAGDTEGPEAPVEEPAPQAAGPVPEGGPRIVINPSVFHDDKDALCVAFNEAFRIVMESMEFNPVSEPTEEQRKFFADTAYSQDENQMRRTILARIATFDTSVKDPTDEQIEETVEFLQSVLEAEIPQTEFEQNAVLRILDTLRQVRSRGTHMSDSSSEASESMPPPSLT